MTGGRQQIQVRDTYIRDFVAPLLHGKAPGVVKLDLVLRGLADEQGLVPEHLTWSRLHAFCRGQSANAGETVLQRKWISAKLDRLVALKLVERVGHGPRPRLVVKSDKGDGTNFDRPGALGDHYVPVLGDLMASDHFGAWGTSEIAAYLAAMNAERWARIDPALRDALSLDDAPQGGGRWMRPLAWFADTAGNYDRPPWHVRFPFPARTLRRGIKALAETGLIHAMWIATDPRNGKQFEHGPRVLYQNGFFDLRGDVNQRRRALRTITNRVVVERPLDALVAEHNSPNPV